jgi:hypothetical protein
MPLINEGYGCIEETANPYTGTAELFWRPLHPVFDNSDAKGALPPDWNENDPAWRYRRLVSITAKEWAYDEKPPFSWFVTVQPATAYFGEWANTASIIYLFVAPHVEVKKFDLDLGSYYKEPDLYIVRLDSLDEVPLPGMEPNLGALVGERPLLEYFDGQLQESDLTEDEIGRSATTSPGAHPKMLPSLKIERGPHGILIEDPTHYRITIRLHETKPSFFRIKISDPSIPRGDSNRTAALYTYSIIHDANTTVEFSMNGFVSELGTDYVRALLKTRKIRRCVKEEARPVSIQVGGSENELDEAMTIVSDTLAETNYYDFDHGKWTFIEPDPDWFGIDTLVSMGIGFIPIVGQLYDIADMVSIAVTGEDLWGVKKTKTDMVLIGAFSLFGVLGDLSKHVDISMMTRIGYYFFPGKKIVSMNPNFARYIVRGSFMGSPAFTHAGETLAKRQGGDLMREMDHLIEAGDEAGLAKLAKKIEDVLEAELLKNAKEIAFEAQPETLAILRKQKEKFGAMLRSMEGKDAALIDDIMETYEKAHADEALSTLIKKIEGRDADAAQALKNALSDQIIEDVNSDPAIVRRAAAYFARYGKPYTPYGYLVNIAGKGTEARVVFEMKYGTEAWHLISGRAPRPKPEDVMKRVATIKGKKVSYTDQIKNWMNNIDTYFHHREQITRDFPGLGILLNSDHLIEARFRKVEHVEGYVDASMFRAMLVPPKLEVARLLRDQGIDIGWYIHELKTARMKQLLPHNKERAYTIQEIADAYQLFWVHEIKMTPTFFRNLFEEEFQFLNHARNGHIVDQGFHNPDAGKILFTGAKTKDELLESVNKTRKKMALPEYVEEKIGERVSDAPGLD